MADVDNLVNNPDENGKAEVDKKQEEPEATKKTTKMNGSPIGMTGTIGAGIIYERKVRAKKIRLFRNGDRFYAGTTYAVPPDRYKTLDSLLADLTVSGVCDKNVLPKGVRFLFPLEGAGRKIESLEELEDGKAYVCSSTASFNSRIPYQASEIPAWNPNAYAGHSSAAAAYGCNSSSSFSSSLPCSPVVSRRSHVLSHLRHVSRDPSIAESLDETDTEFVRPKLVTVFRNGPKPRRAAKVLLNKKTARSLGQALDEVNQAIKLDSGAVKKIFSVSGKQVTCLQDFFGDDVIFFAFGNEKPSADNFVLTTSEIQFVSAAGRMMKFQQPVVNSSHHSKVKNWSSPSDRALSKSRDNSFEGIKSPKSTRGPPSSNGHSFSRDASEGQPTPLRVKYKIGRVIGEGKFAVVRECMEKTRKLPFALKMINKTKVREDYEALKSEVSILRKVKHENIVQLVEEFETPTHHYLILELVNGGDLFELISQMSDYSESDASSMIGDLCCGVCHLHDMAIVHRDIKPENILVHNLKSGQRVLKLADMGLATYATEPLFTVCGTPTYVAPEVIAEVGYGLSADIWSIGVLTYILLCGFPPFSSDIDDQDELFDKILEGKFEFVSPYWDDVSIQAKELIGNMLNLDVAKRPTSVELLRHPWIEGAPSASRKFDQSVSSKIVEMHKQNKSQEGNNSSSAMTNTALDKSLRYFEGRKHGNCDSPKSDSVQN